MSLSTLAPSAGDFDDFRKWALELDEDREPMSADESLPHRSHRSSRGADRQRAIDASLHGREN